MQFLIIYSAPLFHNFLSLTFAFLPSTLLLNTATGNDVDDQRIDVAVAEARDFPLHNIQCDSMAHTANG